MNTEKLFPSSNTDIQSYVWQDPYKAVASVLFNVPFFQVSHSKRQVVKQLILGVSFTDEAEALNLIKHRMGLNSDEDKRMLFLKVYCAALGYLSNKGAFDIDSFDSLEETKNV